MSKQARHSKQAMQALEKANETRLYLADVRRDLALGKRGFAEFLDDPKLQNIKLRWGLMALHRLGRHRAIDLLRQCRVSPSFLERPISDLTERQRGALIGATNKRSLTTQCHDKKVLARA